MLSFLNRFQKKEIIGMDLGQSGVKFVRVFPTLLKRWYYPKPIFPNGDKELSVFRDFLESQGLTGSSVICNMEDLSLKIRRVDLPKMPESDLAEAVRWQLRDVVEGPVTDYVVRYSHLDEYQSGENIKYSLLAYAIKRDVVQTLLDFLKKTSLKVIGVEPAPVSLLAVFDVLHGWKESEAYALIDFGESKSLFSVMERGKLYFSRPLSGISAQRFRLTGMSVPDFHTQIAVEVQKSMDAFTLMFKKERVDHLFLTGGGAVLPDLEKSLARTLATPTTILDPGVRFQMPEPANRYLVALGLALTPQIQENFWP